MATIKYRDFEANSWIDNLEKNFDLQYSFTGTTTKVAILSDIHIGSSGATTEFQSAIDDIDDNLGDIDDVFVLGDIATGGTNAQYDDYLTERNKSDINSSDWHEIPGNHDNDDALSNFKTKLSIDPVYYTVTIGNVVFVLLGDDDGNGNVSSSVTDFLETSLENNQSSNIVIMTHQGHYNTTKGTLIASGTYGYLRPVATIQADLDANNWDAWFCGHSHGYSGMNSPCETGYYASDSSRADIDGEIRSGDWDIGADEYVEASGLSIPVAMHHYNMMRR